MKTSYPPATTKPIKKSQPTKLFKKQEPIITAQFIKVTRQ